MEADARDTTALYDEFSQDYDRFVDWPARLAFEMPFLVTQLQEHGARRILDLACGTGQHAVALARSGFDVTGADLSQAMVARAHANAAEAGVSLDVRQLGFGDLAAGVGRSAYDAIVCLGNSLPHVLTEDDLRATINDIAQVLRPGGLVIIQMRSFDRVLARHERFMPPQPHQSSDGEWLFVRFYDYEGPRLQFNVVRMHRQSDGAWRAQVGRTALYPWQSHELTAHIRAAGMGLLGIYGSLQGEPYAPSESADLVLIAQKAL